MKSYKIELCDETEKVVEIITKELSNLGGKMPIRGGIEISEEDAKRYDELMEQSSYYDRLQYVYKIKLNS